MDKQQLKALNLLPHREPMLLLDEVEITPEGKALGTCRITGEEFFLQGHFPGNPVVPGVMLLEMMAQTCCVLLRTTLTPYFSMVKNAVFKRKVVPGETVTFLCEITRKIGHFYFASGEGTVGDETCVRGDFSFALVGEAEA